MLDCETEKQQVVVTDMLLDQVHFDLTRTSARLAGRKAVAVNLSDLAAMACWPTAAFVSIAIPKNLHAPEKFLTEFYDGMAELSDEFNFTIAGGDTNNWNGPFAVNVCLTGVPMHGQPVLRSGAKPGDALFVTGPLGGSLSSGRHLAFTPQLATAMWLARNVNIHAMMDVSDGLSIDLHRMTEASGTGAVLHEDCVPIHNDVPLSLSHADRLKAAISDGEDFELLIAVASDNAQKLITSEIEFHQVGVVTEDSPTILLETSSGDRTILPESGWQHS